MTATHRCGTLRGLGLAAWGAIFTACFDSPDFGDLACGPQTPCPSGFFSTDALRCLPRGADAGVSVPDSGTTPPPPLPCTGTSTRACYAGPAETLNFGTCRAGEQRCQDEAWGPCVDEVLPEPQERCDGMDRDCDGAVDNGCACRVGETRTCYAGPVGTLGIGICRPGTQTCVGGNWGTCEDQVLPEIEVCSMQDDDCDGQTDEVCDYDPAACSAAPPPMADTSTSAPVPSCSAIEFYVDPAGNDMNDGLSPVTPFATVSRALVDAMPGDCIRVAAGTYAEDVVTVRDGTQEAPILITGPREAVFTGQSSTRVFHVRHSYIYLHGFTIDGLFGEPTDADGYRESLLLVYSATANVGVQGVVVRDLLLQNARFACVRLRYFSTNNEIVDNEFRRCGMNYPITLTEPARADGVNVGTFSDSLVFNPTPDLDESSMNWIHDNVFSELGECVDILEGATGNVFENNDCTGGLVIQAGSVRLRGSWNVVRNNVIHDGEGSGIRANSTEAAEATCNDLVNNTITNNARTGFWLDHAPQLRVCGNTVSGHPDGDTGGLYERFYDPQASCPTADN